MDLRSAPNVVFEKFMTKGKMEFMQQTEHIVISYISIVIVSLSFVLNIIGICLIGKQGARRTNQSLIILHLSILQVLIGSAILAYWISVLSNMAYSDGIMKWDLPILVSSRIIFLLIIAMLTFDRLFSIKYSLRHRNVASKRRINIALAVSWLSWAVGFSIIKLLTKRTYLSAFSLIITVMDCLLLLFILYTYCYIYWRIRMRHRNLINISANNQQLQSGGKQARLVSTAIIVSFAFLVLIPDVVIAIAGHFIDNTKSEIIVNIGIMVNNCYYVALPVNYILLHRGMRGMLMDTIVQCCWRKDRRRNNAVTIEIKEERVHIATI